MEEPTFALSLAPRARLVPGRESIAYHTLPFAVRGPRSTPMFTATASSMPQLRRPMELRSTFGTQITSQRASTPSYGFGSHARFSLTKEGAPVTYFGPAQERSLMGIYGPSPERYTVPSQYSGRQILSYKETSAAWRFPLENRWSTRERIMRKNATPGPGTYRAQT